MNTVEIRIYAELNDHLPEERRKATSWSFEESATVGELLASLGIPEEEVDLVLVNGRSETFHAPLHDGDRVALFPIFETLDISPLVRVREKPLLLCRSREDPRRRRSKRRRGG